MKKTVGKSKKFSWWQKNKTAVTIGGFVGLVVITGGLWIGLSRAASSISYSTAYMLKPEYVGLCLDVQGAYVGIGGKLITWTCNGQTNQRFFIQPASSGRAGYYRIMPEHTTKYNDPGLCLDIYKASTANLVQIQQWTCLKQSNQEWKFSSAGGCTNTTVPTPDCVYYITPGSSLSKCMDVEGASTSPGARVVQYTCHEGKNQRWKITLN